MSSFDKTTWGRRAPSTLLRVLVGLFGLTYAYVLWVNLSQVAGGADSSGYLNLARSISRGRIVEPVEPLRRFGLSEEFIDLFIPLGFVAGPRPGTMSPTYPPGVPLHMALFALLGGWRSAPFLVSPAAALGSMTLIALLARELGLSRWLSFGAAILLGVYPPFLYQAIQPMSDVVATFWAIAAIWTALRSRHSSAWALAAGACFGVAVMVRPTNALLIVPLALALPSKPKPLLLFCLGGLPLGALLLAYNQATYGKALTTGYIYIRLAFSNFRVCFRHYKHWLIILSTPLLPVGWLASAADRRIALKERALILAWFAVFLLFYCFYEPYEDWAALRFLLPGFPAVVLGTLLVTRDLLVIARVSPRQIAQPFRARHVIATCFFLVVLAVCLHHIRHFDVLGVADGESIYPKAAGWLQRTLPESSVVVTMQFSGALKYYTDVTFLRWDAVDPKRFPTLHAQIEAKGYRWFALLAPFEVEDFRKRLPGKWRQTGRLRDVTFWQLETAARIEADQSAVPSSAYTAK